MVGSGFPHPFGGVQLPFNWTQVALLKVHLIVSWRRRTDWTCWMELGQGTRQNLNAQRCTLSSIGFSVFSLCLYVLGFLKNPVVNKSSYFYESHCLLRGVFVPAPPFYQATPHMVRWEAWAVFHIFIVIFKYSPKHHHTPLETGFPSNIFNAHFEHSNRQSCWKHLKLALKSSHVNKNSIW